MENILVIADENPGLHGDSIDGKRLSQQLSNLCVSKIFPYEKNTPAIFFFIEIDRQMAKIDKNRVAKYGESESETTFYDQ